MNRVERAVILAAGYGTRLRPLTEHVPKALLPVNGIPMIESILHALHENAIFEIYVVVGYKKEAFVDLPGKFPGVRLLENPDYATTNNISSLYVARAYLRNAFIMDGDHFIRNSGIFRRNFDRSGYFVVRNEGSTPEWTLDVEDGIIVGCTRGGGCDSFRLVSMSVWSDEDGRQLATDIADVYMTHVRKDIYWDDVPLFIMPEHYKLGVRQISESDLVEIDTLEDLVALDSTYSRFLR